MMSCTLFFMEPPSVPKSRCEILCGSPYGHSHGCVEPVRYYRKMGLDTKTATGVRACRTGFRPNRGACLRRPIRKRRTCGGSRERRALSLGHRTSAAGAVRKLADLLKVTVGFEAVDGRHVRHMHAVEAAVFDDHVQHALLPRRFKIRVDGVAAQRAHRTDKRVRAPIRRAGHHQLVGRHRAGDVLAVVDHPSMA